MGSGLCSMGENHQESSDGEENHQESTILLHINDPGEIDPMWRTFKKHVQTLFQVEKDNIQRATEYGHHGTLQSLVQSRQHQFSMAEIENLFTGIVKGCFWIHQCKVVHFNLNPANIELICEDKNSCKNESPLHMRPVIANFKSALRFDEIAHNKQEFKTSNYTDDQLKSPNWRSKGGVESDMYSLGKILYFLLFQTHYPTENVANTLRLNLNQFLKHHPSHKHYVRFILQSCSDTLEFRPCHADIYLDFLAQDLATENSHLLLQAQLRKFDSLSNDWKVLCIGLSNPVYRLLQLAKRDSELNRIANYSGSESYAGLQFAPDIQQSLHLAADYYSSIILLEFCLLELKVEDLHRKGLISEKLKESWKTSNLKPQLPGIKAGQPNELLNKAIEMVKSWKSRDITSELLDEIQKKKGELLKNLSSHLAKASKPLYDPSSDHIQVKNTLVAHFEQDQHFPLFGMIYIWTNRLELLQKIFDQTFWENKGLFYQQRHSTIASKIQVEFLKKIDQMARLYNEAFLTQSKDSSQEFVQLGPNNPEFLISTEPFKKAGQAWIYEGYWIAGTKQRVVFKLMRNPNDGTTKIDPFRETNLVAKIAENPHILKPLIKLIKAGDDVQMYGIYQNTPWDPNSESEAYYIVSEYFENGNLHDYVMSHREPLQLNLVEFILKGILSGMQAIRQAELIHRDLTPKNVVLAKGLIPKILDFGIALEDKPMENLTSFQEADNQHYRAPEIPNAGDPGAAVFDSRVDTWSVGMIAYFTLFRRTPLTDDEWKTGSRYNKNNTGENLLIPKHEYNSERFLRFLDLVKRCLVSEPEKRIGWADLFKHSLIDLDLSQGNQQNDLVGTSSLQNMVDRIRCYYQVLVTLPIAEFGPNFEGELSEVRKLLVWMIECDVEELQQQYKLASKLLAPHYMVQLESGNFIETQKELLGFTKHLSEHVKDSRDNFEASRRQELFFQRAKALRDKWKEQQQDAGQQQKVAQQQCVLGWVLSLGHKTDVVPPNLESQAELAGRFAADGEWNFRHYLDSPKYT